jgi:hypothetical protein
MNWLLLPHFCFAFSCDFGGATKSTWALANGCRRAGRACPPPFSDSARIDPQRCESAGAAQMALIAELKRRNVFRVGVAYAIVEARRSA